MPKTYHIRFDNGHEGTAWEDELLSHPRHFERPDPEGHIKTSGSDLGSSAVETGDSIQRPSDLGAIHDVYVPDLDIGEGIRCPLCGIRPAEVEIDHATVCKYCANYRYGVPQDDVGEPLWGQTTAAVNHDPELTLYRGEGGHDRPSYYPESGPDSKLTGAWWTSDLDKARGYAAGAGEGAQVYQIKVKPHEAPQRGLPTYHLISDQKVRDRRTLWNDSHEAAVNHPDMTWHFDVDYAQDKDALKRGEIASGTHRVVVRAPTHPQAMAMANEMVFARGSEPTAARLVHYEARQHEAMAWNEHGLGGMSAERAGATSVRHAGFKGYVGSSDEDDDDSDHHDDFDEDLWEKHRPEPTSHEQTHLDHHDEYPDSYHERHEEAYGKALEERKQEDVPDHIDDHLHHWIGEHSTDPESFTRHARQPQQVDLRKGVYATQSHVGQFHIDRYLHGGEEEPSWHSQHGGQGYGYLGEKHPLFVTHQGRLHAIEGHHRVAAALQRGDTHITGWHHDLDKHPIATDTHGSINPSDPGGPCEECHYHEHGFYPHEASLHREAAFHDVRTKAKRLRAEGKVNLLQMPTEAEPYILGQVQGDHGTYHSVIHRLGNSIYQWLCECRWGDFGPFGPDGWQRAASSPYLNRKCSHNLALLYEWQARRMTQPMVTTASFEPQDDGVFYHVTRKENRPTIERHGLDPLFGSDPHDREDGIGPGVWMWGKKPVPGPPPSGENWGNPEKPRYNAEKDDVWEVHPESHHRIERGGEVSSEWLPHEDVHVSYEHFHPHHLRRITSARDDPTEDIEDGSFEDPYPHVGKDGEPHSGVMIALVPPDHVCKDLATKDGEDPYDMHVTLAYLGKDDDVPHDKVHWAMCDLARKLPKLKGKINGFGNFEVDPEKNDGFSHVHLGLVDIPHVGEVYGHMLDSLRTVGLEPSHDHGLSPHMSIQYSHEPMEYDSMPKTKGEEFDIPHITLGYGGKWRHYPLKGSEEIEKTARGEGCPECGEEKPYHNFGCTESMAPKKYFGAQHVEALFGGHSETVCPFKTSGASKSYDRDMVAQRVSHDPDHSEMKDFDPRHLEGTQPGIQRAALQHYMGDDYKRTGQTYADPANKGNKHPVVYTYNHPVTGEEHHMLLSGHHRATAALLKGEMLHARQIRGPVTRRGR
jgi:2'-5' RNA ligase